jgi:hypothetical protein
MVFWWRQQQHNALCTVVDSGAVGCELGVVGLYNRGETTG